MLAALFLLHDYIHKGYNYHGSTYWTYQVVVMMVVVVVVVV